MPKPKRDNIISLRSSLAM